MSDFIYEWSREGPVAVGAADRVETAGPIVARGDADAPNHT